MSTGGQSLVSPSKFTPLRRVGLSPRDFASLSGLSLATVHRRPKAGHIRKWQNGGKNCRIVIPQSELFRSDAAGSHEHETASPGINAKENKPTTSLAGPRPKWAKREKPQGNLNA